MLTRSFDNVHMSQIFSMIISNLVSGELIQAKRDFKHSSSLPEDDSVKLIDYNEYFNSYITKTYYKTASMISLGCRGLGLIFDLDVENQRHLFNFGANLGVGFQVHDDILDFTQDSTTLGKPAFNDIKEGIITGPLMFGLIDYFQKGEMDKFKQLNSIILSKFENKERDVPIGVDLLFESNGIEMADKLSIDFIN